LANADGLNPSQCGFEWTTDIHVSSADRDPFNDVESLKANMDVSKRRMRDMQIRWSQMSEADKESLLQGGFARIERNLGLPDPFG